MLGLGLGLTKGGFIFSLAKSLYKQYVARVTAAGGVQQNAACDIATLTELNSDGLLKQASLVLIPDGIKEDVVFSQVPTSGLGDLTFARASDATYTDSTGVVRRSPYNLAERSQEFENLYWAKTSTSITANNATAPDGTSSADRLVLSGTTSTSRAISRNIAIVSSTPTVTFSAFVKYVDKQYIQLVFSAAFSSQFANFDLINGTVTAGTYVGANVQNYGNGWYRISITTTGLNTNCLPFIWALDTALAGRAADSTSTGTSAYLLWGAQVVEGSFALDYFPTTNRQDVPRIDFSNADGTLSSCGRLLLEPQRTNLALYSEQFDNGAWTKAAVSVSANTTTAPNGTLTADKIIPSSSNFAHSIGQSGFTSAAYTFSVYAKAGEETIISLWLRGNSVRAEFNLSSGTISNITVTSANITAVGNGWYRCSVYDATPGTTASVYGRGGGAYAGNDANGFFLWGAQLEAGTFVSTYIPTTTAAVTRIVDIAEKFGVGSLIGSPAGTIFLQVQILSLGYARSFISLQDASYATNSIRIETTTANRWRIQIRNASTTILDQTVTTGSAFTTGNYKIAYAYDTTTNGVAFYVNGVSLFTTTVASIPTACVNLFLGTRLAGVYDLNVSDSFDQALLFKTRLTNDQLEVLTSEGYPTYALLAQSLNCVLQ